MTSAVHLNEYRQAIDAQIDLAAFYSTKLGQHVMDSWSKLYADIPAERRWVLGPLLTMCTPAYLDQRIAHMLEDAAPTFPDEATLHPEDLVEPLGFIYIGGRGWDTHRAVTPLGYIQRLRAFAWAAGAEGVTIYAFGPAHHPDRATSADDMNQLHLVETWEWGEHVNDEGSAAQAFRIPAEALGNDWRERTVPDGWNDERARPANKLRTYGEAYDSLLERTYNIRRVVYAVWHFMRQRISVTTSRPLDRAGRRQLERAGWKNEPVVQVIELRAKAYARLDAVEHAERTYSVQWIVRGHWRNQWFPKDERHKPIWIEAYVKGPEGAPIKGATKLYAIVK